MPKSIHKLDIPIQSAAFLGIACAESIQRFTWLINRIHGTEFSFLDISTTSAQHLLQPFATFHFNSEESGHHLLLISTRSEGVNLLPNMKNLDYLFGCIGSDPDEIISQWNSKLRQIPEVVGCFTLSSERGLLKKLASLLLK